MPHEIERKFLLKSIPTDLANYPHHHIEQGYLMATPDGKQVRLRRTDSGCTFTFKTEEGAVREEREIDITTEQFNALWPATAGKRLSKTRHKIPWKGLTIEIDIYEGIHKGLTVAEVEFPNREACHKFQAPDWFGEEVTNNSRYSNVVLARE